MILFISHHPRFLLLFEVPYLRGFSICGLGVRGYVFGYTASLSIFVVSTSSCIRAFRLSVHLLYLSLFVLPGLDLVFGAPDPSLFRGILAGFPLVGLWSPLRFFYAVLRL